MIKIKNTNIMVFKITDTWLHENSCFINFSMIDGDSSSTFGLRYMNDGMVCECICSVCCKISSVIAIFLTLQNMKIQKTITILEIPVVKTIRMVFESGHVASGSKFCVNKGCSSMFLGDIIWKVGNHDSWVINDWTCSLTIFP